MTRGAARASTSTAATSQSANKIARGGTKLASARAYALVPNGREPAFLDLLRNHVDGPNPHPFASVVLHRLSSYQARWSQAGGRTLLSRTRPSGDVPPPRRLEAIVNGVRIRLTAREADVLDQLGLGSSYTDIAEALFITQNTVKKHLMSLYRKLGVESAPRHSASLATLT